MTGVQDRMRVSVVIATFNGARYIREQLTSIVEQSAPPFEIIISDDNSSDGTLDIVKTIDFKSTKVHVIKNSPALGFSENFLAAAATARGEIVAFSDQDDIWRSDKLLRCAHYFSKPEVVLVTHRATLIDSRGSYIGEFSQGINKSTSHSPLHYHPWWTFFGFSMLVRASVLRVEDRSRRGIDFISGRQALSHDRWVMFLAGALGVTVEVADSLVAYRQHGANLFGASPDECLEAEARLALRDRAARHELSADAFAQIVGDWDAETLRRDFPRFRKERAVSYWQRAGRQQKWRLHFYNSGNRRSALRMFFRALRAGAYVNYSGRGLDLRALGRDVKSITLF